MATSLVLYNFSKRINSTARPGDGTSFDVVMKDVTSIYNPTFILYSTSFLPTAYNYAQLEGYYYYINDCVTLSNYTYELQCRIDVLASWCDDILSSSQFVERSAISYNTMIADPLLVPTLDYTHYTTSVLPANALGFTPLDYFIVRIVGYTTTTTLNATGIMTYGMYGYQLAEILNFAYTQDNFSEIFSDAIAQAVFDPFKYIVSVDKCPFAGQITGNDQVVRLGYYNTGVTATLITTSAWVNFSYTLSMPETGYADFRHYDDRFTMIQHTLYMVGVVGIPAKYIDKTITATYKCDLVGGEAHIILSADGDLIANYTARCTAPVQIGQNKTALSTIIGSLLGSGSSVVSGGITGGMYAGGVGATAGATVSGVSSLGGAIVSSMSPATSVNGSVGGSTLLFPDSLTTTVTEMGTAEYPTTREGRPLYQTVTLSSISGGFCQCQGGNVSCSAPDNLKREINTYLNTGIYLE